MVSSYYVVAASFANITSFLLVQRGLSESGK